MDNFNVYNDIKARTNGEIYIGVVGPVRTGKSTFIKRFMDLLVIPNISDEKAREQAVDELPQSAAGKTIMTTEPKFIPKDAVSVDVGDGIELKVRMIDCVGYMVGGAVGHMENEQERLVKTPWFDYEIPFTKAAEIGTKKVINDHSTIGIVVTTDGSFTDISRADYEVPEEKTINELKALRKPFIVLLNTEKPYSNEAKELAQDISKKHGVVVIPMNCEQLKQNDIQDILKQILLEFPISTMEFTVPKWLEALSNDHWLKKDIIQLVKENFEQFSNVNDLYDKQFSTIDPVKSIKINKVEMDTGKALVQIDVREAYYYQILSDVIGLPIENEFQLIHTMKDLAKGKIEYDKVANALHTMQFKGYGIVTPAKEEIRIEQPEVIKHGNKYGIKIKAQAPSIHLIKTDITTEIAPIVGSEQQAIDLIEYIKQESSEGGKGIWDVNVFGKTVEQLVEDGIQSKANKMDDENQLKLQDTLEKIINEGNGGLVCLII